MFGKEIDTRPTIMIQKAANKESSSPLKANKQGQSIGNQIFSTGLKINQTGNVAIGDKESGKLEEEEKKQIVNQLKTSKQPSGSSPTLEVKS